MSRPNRARTSLVDAIVNQTPGQGLTLQAYTWISVESVDGNLSKIQDLMGSTFRFVPKWRSVGTPVAGDTVHCLQGPNTKLVIVGILDGDITLAS